MTIPTNARGTAYRLFESESHAVLVFRSLENANAPGSLEGNHRLWLIFGFVGVIPSFCLLRTSKLLLLSAETWGTLHSLNRRWLFPK